MEFKEIRSKFTWPSSRSIWKIPKGKIKNQSVINEANSDSKYMGQNRKNLEIRFNENFLRTKFVSEEKSAVAKYCLRTGNTISK